MREILRKEYERNIRRIREILRKENERNIKKGG